MIKIVFKDFFQFLYKPNSRKFEFKNKKGIIIKKLFLTFGFEIISVVTGIILLIVGRTILITLGVELPEMTNLAKNVAKEKFSVFTIFLISAIIAPVTEEISFRLSLKFNSFNLALSLSVLYLSLKFFSKLSFYLGEFTINYILLHLSIGIIIFVASFFILKIKRIDLFFKYLYENYFRIIFYLVVIFFGMLHFGGDFSIYTFTSTMPQIIGGIFLGYVRLKFGFQYAILMHFTGNAFIAIF